jgi:hypothetical protein
VGKLRLQFVWPQSPKTETAYPRFKGLEDSCMHVILGVNKLHKAIVLPLRSHQLS